LIKVDVSRPRLLVGAFGDFDAANSGTPYGRFKHAFPIELVERFLVIIIATINRNGWGWEANRWVLPPPRYGARADTVALGNPTRRQPLLWFFRHLVLVILLIADVSVTRN
jgi:hypothetical protein